MKISKELLGKVLCDNQVDFVKVHRSKVWFNNQYKGCHRIWANSCINVYELAFECKEYVKRSNYQIHSTTCIKAGGYAELTYRWDNDDFISPEFVADTEVEAIFIATAWVMDIIKKDI